MGEARRKQEMARREVADVCGLELPAGKVRVLWDRRAAATPLGQMPYFIEFLHLSGLWRQWLEDCPLADTSPNAPGKADVLGTWLLSILAGHNRYAHITALRGSITAIGDIGYRRFLGFEDFEERSPRMCPACGLLDPATSVQVVKPSIGIGLQNAFESSQMIAGMLTLAVR